MHWFNTCYFGLFTAIGILSYCGRDIHDRKTEKGPRDIFWISAVIAYPVFVTWSFICLLISLRCGFWMTQAASFIIYLVLDLATSKAMEIIHLRPSPALEKAILLVTAPEIALIQPILRALAPVRTAIRWSEPLRAASVCLLPVLVPIDIMHFRRMTRGSAPP